MTKPLGPLPNFFVVGTAKCATTSLAHFFEQHPDVCFSQVHEPDFFAIDSAYAGGVDTYRSLYNHYSGETAIGEKSWRYSCKDSYPDALPRMLEHCGPFKALYVVRDPLPRAISMWREMRDAGNTRLPADPNLALRQENIVVESSRYNTQIRRFEESIGSENVRVVLFEDFCDDPAGFYRQICDFLNIAPFEPDESIHANPSVEQRSDGVVLEALRSTGLDDPLRRLAPAPVRNAIRKLFKRPIGEIAISADTRRAFLDLVGEDCSALLDRLGRDRSIWDLK